MCIAQITIYSQHYGLLACVNNFLMISIPRIQSPVLPSVHMSCKHMDELILMKLCTFAECVLRICMKLDNPSPTYFKGVN